jgi:Calcineurin-like phosphoesterase
MRVQVLSDLHLETQACEPLPAPHADVLVLAGDVDSTWAGLDRFRSWPVPVLFVAGNHEFDGRELSTAWPALSERCQTLGIRLLECESQILADARGRRIRFVATIRWCDFDLYGIAGRDRAMRAAGYYVRVMRATLHGAVFDAASVREQALACRTWLEAELRQPPNDWDATVVITHYAPSLRSADPRYGRQAGTASFCNADDELIPLAQLWIHGHLHWRHDYSVAHETGSTRVVCNARGYEYKGEAAGYDGQRVFEV